MDWEVASTLRKSGEIELGPLEEKSATMGAGALFRTVLLGNICIVGGRLLRMHVDGKHHTQSGPEINLNTMVCIDAS